MPCSHLQQYHVIRDMSIVVYMYPQCAPLGAPLSQAGGAKTLAVVALLCCTSMYHTAQGWIEAIEGNEFASWYRRQ